MNWRDEVANGFPEPRDDEPESLRQNIVDELADHLSCALVRELHFTTDERTAIQRVLDRFGDPRKIARRLWLDSMKEKLMSQRIALATSILAAAASIAACVMVYFVVNESRTAIQSLVEQGSDKDQAILDRLEKLASRPAATTNPEWNPAKLRLVQEKTGGPPAVGYLVTLQASGGQAGGMHIEETSDSAGVVDFGLLPAGGYGLIIWTPEKQEFANANYSVRAGRPADMELVCASPKPASSEVNVAIEWPVDLNGGFRVHGFFRRTGRLIAGRAWTPSQAPYQHLILTSKPGVFDLTGHKKNGSFSQVAQALDFNQQDSHNRQQVVSWPEGKYVLAGLEFFGPAHKLKDSEISTNYWGGYQYLGFANADVAHTSGWFGGGGGFGGGSGGGGGGGFFSVSDSPRVLLLQAQPAMQFGGGARSGGGDDNVDSLPAPTFEVKPGVENVWKISLPDAVIESLRKQLADPNSAPSSVEPKPAEPKRQVDAPNGSKNLDDPK